MTKADDLGLHYHVQGHTSGLPEPVVECLSDAPQKLAAVVAASGRGLGEGITVAVLDSGFTHHPFLETSLANPRRPVSQNDLDRWEMSAPTVPAYMGHGTFVAGVVRRYAPAAHILYRRVTDTTGVGHDWALAGAIDNLIPRTDDLPGPDVLNLSLGPGDHEFLEHSHGSVTPRTRGAIRALQDACGTIVVIAAGPRGEPLDPRLLLAEPGERTVFVGAHGPDGEPAEFSANDAFVNIFAPGVGVLGPYIHWNGQVHLDTSCAACNKRLASAQGTDTTVTVDFAGWARWSGTSFAAPAVAGALASAMSKEPADENQAESVQERRLRALRDIVQNGTEAADGRLRLAARPWLPDDLSTAASAAQGNGCGP